MTVVYVDSVFLLNSLIDYLLFLLTARLAGLQLRRWRYVLAGLLGGIYAVAIFLPFGSFLALTPVKIMAGVLLSLVAYGGEELFLRLTLVFFGISCAFAGGILGVGLLAGRTIPRIQGVFFTNIDAKILVISATVIYFLAQLVFRTSIEQVVQGKRIPVTLCVDGKQCTLIALQDTGNGLKDLRGTSVLVVELRALVSILPPEVSRKIEQGSSPAELIEILRKQKPALQPQLLCYRSVGQGEGLLLTLRSDWSEIGGKLFPALRIAISPTPLGEGFQALWGGATERGKRYENHGKVVSTVDPSGSAAERRNSLHRWQRYSSAAVNKGAGSGIADLLKSGSGPERIDRA